MSTLEPIPHVKDPVLNSMLEEMMTAPVIYQPSKFWVHYAIKNIKEIEADGINNFKQTVNRNYFNWTGWELEEHRNCIVEKIDGLTSLIAQLIAKLSSDIGQRPNDLSDHYWNRYREYVALLWEFTKKRDKLGILRRLQEPDIGNPFTFKYKGKRVSQDICNSVLEINSLAEGTGYDLNTLDALELGGGYGRTASVVLSSFAKAKMTMVDIPPALHICQWYLSKLYPNRKIFGYRPFKSFDEIKDEFLEASIRFLLPHQLELLPPKSFNACINISSLHEMTQEQISHFFKLIDQLVKGHFYMKQWIRSINDYDAIIVERDAYPVKDTWRQLFNRPCEVQTSFFEALYYIP